MGTTAHLIVTGGPRLLVDRAQAELLTLEQRWSRFLSDSELSRLNRLAGRPTVVSPLTFALIERAVAAWRQTAGAFDPTVLSALCQAGYDRDFGSLRPDPDARCGVEPGPTAGCAEIELDSTVSSVRLPRGVTLDLGGIAKGFAADHVAEALMVAGCAGACVNIGGDLRVIGESPSGEGWVIGVDAEVPDSIAPPSLALDAGAVATSSRTRRVWTRGTTRSHHLIDPRTGSSARTPWVAATVVAGRAVDAEPLAKAAFLARDHASAAAVLSRNGACGLLVTEAGELIELGTVQPYIAR